MSPGAEGGHSSIQKALALVHPQGLKQHWRSEEWGRKRQSARQELCLFLIWERKPWMQGRPAVSLPAPKILA